MKRSWLYPLIVKLALSLICGALCFFLLGLIPSPVLKLHQIVPHYGENDLSVLLDMNNDGRHELVTRRTMREGIATIYLKDGQAGEYQHNFETGWLNPQIVLVCNEDLGE